MQQNRPTFQRTAVPTRLSERATAELLGAPTPFVLRPAPREVAAQQPSQRQVLVCLSPIGVQANRLLIGQQCFFDAALLLQNQAQILVPESVIGLIVDALAEAGLGFGRTSLLDEGDAQMIVQASRTRPLPQRLPETFFRLRQASHPAPSIAQAEQDLDIPRTLSQGFLQAGGCLVHLALLDQGTAQKQSRQGILGLEDQRLL